MATKTESKEVLVTVGDLLQIPEIAQAKSQVSVLRLSNNNIIALNGRNYELRMFCFYLPESIVNVSTFEEYVRHRRFEEKVLIRQTESPLIQPLYYSNVHTGSYLLISILEQP